MNIKQLRYVVAIANSGTFREASEQLFVSQPSMSIAVKDLEQELGFQIFERTNTGATLTIEGERFYEQAQTVLRNFETFESKYSKPKESDKTFSVASQHYDFLAPVAVEFAKKILKSKILEFLSQPLIIFCKKWRKGTVNSEWFISINKIAQGF